MKTFLVLSDTHGNVTAINRLREIIGESDYLVHLGDNERDIVEYKMRFPNKVISVKGNCDGGGVDKEMTVESVKILFTHGDRHGVKNGLERLYYYSKEKGYDLVLYGHTHIASCQKAEEITFINPGTLKKYEPNKSYAYLILHQGKITCKIIEVKNAE